MAVRQRNTSLTRNANYTTNNKALRKWAEQRLDLTVLNDRTIEARFRYEGTTCTNLGHALAFDYRVVLDTPERAYRILEATCSPTPGHHGYQSMCKYISDAQLLMNAIDAEEPLLERPLDDVLNWERRFSPAGCYCNAASRMHKWGLVLEVVHFALVQAETTPHSTIPSIRKTL